MSDKPFRVLSIEGGGMRGYYTATLLNALCRLFNEGSSNVDFGKNLNLICGTSTGAILACTIAKGILLQEVMKMYKKEGKQIFSRPVPKSIIKKICWSVQHFRNHSAETEYLKNALESYFNSVTLEDVYKERGIALCIPAVNANNHRAWLFKTPHEKDLNRDKKYSLVDVCMASAAAPFLFSPHIVENPSNPDNVQCFVDGGIWANSPVLVALVEAVRIAQPEQEIHILSVGTAAAPNDGSKTLRKSQWGIKQWGYGRGVIEMSISAISYWHYSMAYVMANSFSRNGREIKIMKLTEKLKSLDKYSAIGIDKADDKAIHTMSEMAESDALENYSQIVTRNENPEIRAFFETQTLQEETDNGTQKY